MATYKVKIWGSRCEVETYQKTKETWVAAGTYMGRQLETQDLTEAGALVRWCEAAKYRPASDR